MVVGSRCRQGRGGVAGFRACRALFGNGAVVQGFLCAGGGVSGYGTGMSGDDAVGVVAGSVGVRERQRDWGVPEKKAHTDIWFRSPHGTVVVGGCEWWGLRTVLADLAAAMLDLDDEATMRRLTSLLPSDHRLCIDYVRGARSPQPWRSVVTAHFRDSFSADEPGLLAFNGRPIDTMPLVLNTALRVGGDALRLAARVCGQAAVHGWVDGPHRAWLAEKIQDALDVGVFASRQETDTREPAFMIYHVPTRWDEVIELLRSRDDEPVVMTTGNGFPDSAVQDLYHLPEYAEFSAHTESPDRWQAAVGDLRAGSPSLELRPDTWESVSLGHGLSVLDLRADDGAARIANAVVEPALVRVALTRHLDDAGAVSWSAAWGVGGEGYDGAHRELPDLVAEILDDVRGWANEHVVVALDWALHGEFRNTGSVRDTIAALGISLPERVLSKYVS